MSRAAGAGRAGVAGAAAAEHNAVAGGGGVAGAVVLLRLRAGFIRSVVWFDCSTGFV